MDVAFGGRGPGWRFGSALALSCPGRARRRLVHTLSTLALRDDWAPLMLGLGDIKMSN